ncbi:MAG: class I SAM-dependent methyltransferase [Gammaproteobacteria bacterium]|jgi:SAM-dependent methyltransferase
MARHQRVFERLYGSASSPEDLPWHGNDPPGLLVKALDLRDSPGTALDLGCGAGTYSLYMARRGYRVTAVDFMPQAVEMLGRRAAHEGLEIDAVQADINDWDCESQFDVVLDVGCLHTPHTVNRQWYKQQLLKRMAPGGDFILLHFGSRGFWDKWPVGPSRVPRSAVIALFAPDLVEHEYVSKRLENMPWLMGRGARVGTYWFKRPATACLAAPR